MEKTQENEEKKIRGGRNRKGKSVRKEGRECRRQSRKSRLRKRERGN
jgi:hypothetical protein